MTLDNLPTIIPAIGVIALLFTWWKTRSINIIPEGSERMKKIAKSIQDGAMAFLRAEYRVLSCICHRGCCPPLLEWQQ